MGSPGALALVRVNVWTTLSAFTLVYSKNTQCVWVRRGAHLSQLVVKRATTSPVVQAWRGRSSFRDEPRPVLF